MAADSENINFLDLACLYKIGDDTTLERFGSVINASVFDAANITGSLKQKGLIDFTAYYPGPNSIVVTDFGKQLKQEADAKGAEALDSLDDEILRQMSGGKRFPAELQSTLNIRSKDLAFRIYKLFKQNLVGYELKNGNVELMLTEQGFLKTKPVQTLQVPPIPAPMNPEALKAEMKTQHPNNTQQQQPAPAQPQGAQQAANGQKAPKKRSGKLKIAVILVVIILLVFIVLYKKGMLPFTLPFSLPFLS